MIEKKIHQVLWHRWEKTAYCFDSTRYVIGVDYVGWGELGGDDDTKSMIFSSRGRVFEVVPVSGLPEGSVALIWQ